MPHPSCLKIPIPTVSHFIQSTEINCGTLHGPVAVKLAGEIVVKRRGGIAGTLSCKTPAGR